MRTLTCAVLAASLVLLTACSGDPEPASPLPTGSPAPTSEPAPVPTPEPTPDAGPTGDGAAVPSPSASATTPAPSLPPEATTNDAPGAEAFVRYWYDAFNHSVLTGDTTALRAASLLPECVECESLASDIEEAYSGGLRLEGGTVVVVEAVAPTPDQTGLVLLSVVIDQEPAATIDPDGEVVGRSDDSDVGVSDQSAVISWDSQAEVWSMVGLAR